MTETSTSIVTMTLKAPQPTAPPSDKFSRRPTKPLPQSLIQSSRLTTPEPFSVTKHVKYQPPAKIYTMADLGLGRQGISPIAISAPFPLFTEEAIKQMRREVFSEVVLERHQYASSFCENMVRGMCPRDAPFIYDAWNDQTVLNAISEIAGIELVPAWDYDIGNVNISVPSEEQSRIGTGMLTSSNGGETVLKPAKGEHDEEDDTAFGWHYDSVPFVCVTMLSDCTGMVGGETMIRTGDGRYMKMRGPAMGTAVLMQGRYIPHRALKALGGRERISMVCSLRPNSAFLKDESVLTGVRGISYVPELYYQFASYRLKNLEQRVRGESERMEKRRGGGREFELAEARRFLVEQREYIDAMLGELVEVK